MRRILLSAVCLFLLIAAPVLGAAGHAEERIEMTLDGSLGNLFGELTIPETDGPAPLVILSHGFGGNLVGNRGAAACFNARGFATFNYDFCGGGFGIQSDGSLVQMTVLTEAQDLNAVIDAFKDDPRFSCIFLWGASQGGFVSCYVAAQRPEDVAALVMEFPAFVLQDDAKARALPDGSFPPTSVCMGVTIGRCYNEAAVSFDIYEHMRGYTGDALILHGDRDRIVPLLYSERAAETLPSAELIVMAGQDHGFAEPARTEALEHEAAFFEAHLPAGE